MKLNEVLSRPHNKRKAETYTVNNIVMKFDSEKLDVNSAREFIQQLLDKSGIPVNSIKNKGMFDIEAVTAELIDNQLTFTQITSVIDGVSSHRQSLGLDISLQ